MFQSGFSRLPVVPLLSRDSNWQNHLAKEQHYNADTIDPQHLLQAFKMQLGATSSLQAQWFVSNNQDEGMALSRKKKFVPGIHQHFDVWYLSSQGKTQSGGNINSEVKQVFLFVCFVFSFFSMFVFRQSTQEKMWNSPWRRNPWK